MTLTPIDTVESEQTDSTIEMEAREGTEGIVRRVETEGTQDTSAQPRLTSASLAASEPSTNSFDYPVPSWEEYKQLHRPKTCDPVLQRAYEQGGTRL